MLHIYPKAKLAFGTSLSEQYYSILFQPCHQCIVIFNYLFNYYICRRILLYYNILLLRVDEFVQQQRRQSADELKEAATTATTNEQRNLQSLRMQLHCLSKKSFFYQMTFLYRWIRFFNAHLLVQVGKLIFN